jgi:hypothetical protein
MQNTMSQAEQKGVWSPDLRFSNALGPFQTIVDKITSGRVIRGSEPVRTTRIDPLEGEIFNSTLNSMLFTREYYYDFGCNFDLRSYPFDSQVKHFRNLIILILEIHM